MRNHHSDHGVDAGRRGKRAGVGDEEVAHAEDLAIGVADRRATVTAHAAGAHLMRAEVRRPVTVERTAGKIRTKRIDRRRRQFGAPAQGLRGQVERQYLVSPRGHMDAHRRGDPMMQMGTHLRPEAVVGHRTAAAPQPYMASHLVPGDNDDRARMRRALHVAAMIARVTPRQGQGHQAGMYGHRFELHAICTRSAANWSHRIVCGGPRHASISSS